MTTNPTELVSVDSGLCTTRGSKVRRRSAKALIHRDKLEGEEDRCQASSATTPPSSSRWIRAFALRENRKCGDVVQKPWSIETSSKGGRQMPSKLGHNPTELVSVDSGFCTTRESKVWRRSAKALTHRDKLEGEEDRCQANSAADPTELVSVDSGLCTTRGSEVRRRSAKALIHRGKLEGGGRQMRSKLGHRPHRARLGGFWPLHYARLGSVTT
jgi:hypothetical protein